MTLIVSFDDGALEMIHGLHRMEFKREYETLTSGGTLQVENCSRNDKQRLLENISARYVSCL